MEKGVIHEMMVCKGFGLIPKARKEMKMIFQSMIRSLRHRRILNDMKKEISKLMGVGKTM
jgi:hypothetical protein